MKVKTLLNSILIALLFVIFGACQSDNLINITDAGNSDYRILIKEKNSEKVIFAAKELQKYLMKMSGVELPIEYEIPNLSKGKYIVIGQREVDKSALEIVVIDDDLFIGGGDDDSTLFAVYEFLEVVLNCQWLTPEVEMIPEQSKIMINSDLNYYYLPEITTRTVHSKLFYDHPEFANKRKVTTEAFPRYVPGAKVHTFHRFVPEEKYYESHPEYFALVGSQRLPTQLCLTNRDVLKIVIDAVDVMFKQHPGASVISVSQNDNQQFCQCDQCKAIDTEEGSQSGTMIRFVNEVAKAFPDKTISTLAYQYTRKPSITAPANNVLITLCSIECDRSAPIEEKCGDFAADLKGWKELTNQIRIWDYTTQFTNFLAPFPNIHTLAANIILFKNSHANWIFEQHSHQPSELFELRSYLLARLLWNPESDLDQLIAEFTNSYYGAGGKYVKKYIDDIHLSIQQHDDFFLFLYGDPSQAFDSFLSPEQLAKYDQYFDLAEKAVADDVELLNRIKAARSGIDYAILEACRKNLSQKYTLVLNNEENGKSKNPLVIDRLHRFSTNAARMNIRRMNEMGYEVTEYIDNYIKAIDVALQPNKALGKNVKLLTQPKKYANEDPQVLTDGELGGNGFYANWLGFEGNHLEAIIDLEKLTEISSISTAFLQVTNHVVFFPVSVEYFVSTNGVNYTSLGIVNNSSPLTKKSKVNDIQYFNLNFKETNGRYVKIKAMNMGEPPYWHHAAGTPSWIFADELIID